MIKENYENAEIELIRFVTHDIITTSSNGAIPGTEQGDDSEDNE